MLVRRVEPYRPSCTPVTCSDKVPRYAVTVFDRAPKPSFDRFAFGFERAIFGRADRSALVGLAASIGPLNSTS
jgi:hypothetical protein